MDIVTIVGLGLVLVLVFGPLIVGGTIMYFIDIPSFVIVVLGASAAVAIGYTVKDLTNFINALRQAFFPKVQDLQSTINLLVDLGEKARREGILALERELKAIESAYLRKAIQLAVDGNEVEIIQTVMQTEIDYIEERHKLNIKICRDFASLAPAYGMVGTLIGLIQMLKNLDDPSALGPGMAVALVTTFYGSLMANWIFTPLSNKLERRHNEEILIKQMTLAGILSIQSGDNPRILRDKLETFISPSLRQTSEQ